MLSTKSQIRKYSVNTWTVNAPLYQKPIFY
jgi:hypothetical protein